MMDVYQIYNQIKEKLGTLPATWDNSGFQVIVKPKVEKVLLSETLTDLIVNKAIKEEVDLVITHHPLIFPNLRKIDYRYPVDMKIIRLIKNGINHIAFHTDFDNSEWGASFSIASLLCKREDIRFVEPFGVVFEIESRKLKDIVSRLTSKYEIKGIVNNYPLRNVRKIFVCSGSGNGFLRQLVDLDIDLFITGELNYHDIADYQETKISVVLLGHYESEESFNDKMEKLLLEINPNLTILKEKSHQELL